MSEPPSSLFVWHEKYHRYYRDFESGGEYGDLPLNYALIELARPLVSTV
jgi:hypothetical protein